jgi:predicted nucleic acid-binding protein
MTKTYVLDASALMTFFENRTGADKVEELLTGAADTQRPLAMSVINWGEVYYAIWRAHGEKAAAAKLQEIVQLPIQVFDVDMALAKVAASLKAQYNLPYADSFAAALAQTRKSTVVTCDKDFERAGDVLKVLWV